MTDYEAVSGSVSHTDFTITKHAEGVSLPVSGAGASGIEETSPDMLKNTPSNIARLEDKIEQCKGRRKYLAQTRSPSDGGDVRWYYCKVPLAENELAASVPRTQIVGKSEYFRFGMRDSLAIEASFLEREEELLSPWWREYAECSEGPRAWPSSSKKLGNPSNASSIESVEEERVGVPVKGGLYEVDLVKRHCFPVYWNGENRRVLRGHWFVCKGGVDWLPLREDVAEQLEIAYRGQVWRRRTFQPSGLFAARVDLQGSTPGLHALFTGEDDTWEAWFNADASGFSSVIPLGGKGIQLRRGYATSQSPKPTQDELRQQKEEEMDDYCSQVPVGHLVFMVHGIGQRLEKSNLVDDVGTFRHIAASLAERHLTSHQRGSQRVLFIPCQWRKSLKLSGEAAVEKITLEGVRGLRIMLGATVHDVLYYMNPIHCQHIIDSVSNQLNLLYLKFLKRNPGYNGKVSIYGHSLGSVLSYDILCHQENLSSPFPMEFMYKEHDKREKSYPDTNNRSTVRNPLTNNMGQKKSCLGYETENSVGPNNENAISTQPSFLVCARDVSDGNAEDVSTIIGSNSSDSDEVVSATAIITEKLSCLEDIPRLIYDNKDMVLGENNTKCISTGRNNEAPTDDLGVMTQEACDYASSQDNVIVSLTAEIDSLKAKIAELESQYDSGHGSSRLQQEIVERLSTKLEKRLSEKIPLGQDTPKSYTLNIKYTKLEFKVDTFFAVGSPLGVFLALRNVRIGIGKGQDYWEEETINEEMPACRQMFNIFHPFDPVAYRIEPLVCKEYIGKRPVIVPYHKGGKRLHIGFQEFAEDLAVRSQAVMDHLHSVRVKVLTVCQSKNIDSLEGGAETAQEKEEQSYGSLMMERLTGSKEGQIDHVLQDKTFQHPYISAVGAHTNYWRDYDTALFILKHLYRNIPVELNSSEKISRDYLNNKGGSIDWSIEERLSKKSIL